MSTEHQPGLPSPIHVFWHVVSAQRKRNLLLIALPREDRSDSALSPLTRARIDPGFGKALVLLSALPTGSLMLLRIPTFLFLLTGSNPPLLSALLDFTRLPSSTSPLLTVPMPWHMVF